MRVLRSIKSNEVMINEKGVLPETSRNLLASGTVGSTPLVLVETTGEGLPMPMLENGEKM